MTLTVSQARGHISTGLGDTALELLLDAAYETLDDYLGTNAGAYEGTITEILTAGNGDLLMLSRRAMSISAVTEAGAVLASGKYRLSPSGSLLMRLPAGTWWSGRVEVRYAPFVGEAERDRVAIALVNLSLNYIPGVTAETVGAWMRQKAQAPNVFIEERKAILASYGAPSTFIF